MSSHPPQDPNSRRIFDGYAPPNDTFDEMVAAGAIRPEWQAFSQELERIGAHELQRRWEQAQRQIRNDGVTFHPQGAANESSRPWTLDAIPLLVTERQWRQVTDGLEQRALLLDLIVRDLFGPQQLLRERMLPAEFLFDNPTFHPAYHGLVAAHRRHLHLYAADLARASDGRWWVTGDRTRAPFGLGYVLENRIVTSRMLSGPFRQCRVQRLARFYIRLRETLRELASRYRENPRIVLWTKGPSSTSYFEDAYLARYLGYTLVEGGDLAVRENRVMLKTLGGLLPVEVLLRRLDDDDCDPVELSPESSVGVPGLMEVLREGNASCANALGTRLVEAPMLMAFLPRICERMLGEPLRLPSVATWWCGDPKSAAEVYDRFDSLLIRSAFRTADEPPVHPGLLSRAERDQWLRRVKANPARFVAQEPVQRSTAPVWHDSHCVAWSLAVRSFLVSSGERYEALPGGLVRVSPQAEVLDRTMTAGERSQDLWVLAEGPVDEVSLLAPAGQPLALRRSGAELPSRVADNLYWLGRNVERAEASIRLLRTVLTLATGERERVPELTILLRAVAEFGQIEPDFVVEGLRQQLPDVIDVLPEAIFDVKQSRSLRSTVDEVVRLASIVRDRVAIDMWRIIHRIDEACRRPRHRRKVDAAEVLDILDQLVTEFVALSGLSSESMTRTQGWRFLELGRRVERIWQEAVLLRATLGNTSPDETAVLEAVLQTVDSIMTYRSRYLATLQPAAVLDLLLTDDTNPRSLRYQLDRIEEHVTELPRGEQVAQLTAEQRLAASLRHSVLLADVYELAKPDTKGERTALIKLLSRLIDRLPKLSDAISNRYLIHAGMQRHFAGGTPGLSRDET